MKFTSLVAFVVIAALGASEAVARPSIYDVDMLPNGINLPRRNRHPLSEQRRRSMVDAYYQDHPQELKRELRKRGGSAKSCKAKTANASNKPVSASKTSSSQQPAANEPASQKPESHSSSSSHTSSKSQDKSDDKDSSSKSDSKDSDGKSDSKSDSKDSDSESSSGSSSSSGSNGAGLFGMKFSGSCSNPNASDKYPNGDISFLNCGISKSNPSSKWKPPMVKMSELKVVSAHQAASAAVFKPCAKYESAFSKAEQATGVPAVLLMSFAMQESTCNPNARGGNGEIGMMQLTPDKCGDGSCYSAEGNVMKGAKYFKQELDNRGGNVLEAMGAYNGWSLSTSYSSATNQQYGCHAQNNLDYLNQMLNGFCQGVSGYDLKVYNNLGSC